MVVLLHASRSVGYATPLFLSVACVAIVCSCGIVWSRLALGAHYLSDVVGGIMLGAATLALYAQILAAFGYAST